MVGVTGIGFSRCIGVTTEGFQDNACQFIYINTIAYTGLPATLFAT